MIKLIDILSEIKVLPPNTPTMFPVKLDKNNIDRVLKYLYNLGYRWRSHTSLLDGGATDRIKEYLNNDNNTIYLDVHGNSSDIFYSKDTEYEENKTSEHRSVKRMNEIKINQPFKGDFNLVNKMLNLVDRSSVFDYDEYIDINNNIKSKANIDIDDYWDKNEQEYNIKDIPHNGLISIYNILKPYFDEKNINIKEL